MSSFVAIDDPDRVVGWFDCYPEAQRARKPIGPCPHDCKHLGTSVVGYGPDLDHYELVICEDDGCAGNCRGWRPTDDNAHGGTNGKRYVHALFHPDMRQLSPLETAP